MSAPALFSSPADPASLGVCVAVKKLDLQNVIGSAIHEDVRKSIASKYTASLPTQSPEQGQAE